MTLQELKGLISRKSGIAQGEVSVVLNAYAEIITENAINGTETPIPGVGKLKVTELAARKGRNPSTGETIQIPATKALRVSVSKNLKDRLK